MTTYTYQTIDPPGSTYTIARSINSKGEIDSLDRLLDQRVGACTHKIETA
jgi:hypothetical protein